MEGIDLFSGAGGMSLGAIMAGINVSTAVESNIHAAATFKNNHPETTVLCQDVREIDLKKIGRSIFVVFGGPPCQGFSRSNTKTRTLENKNNTLFEEFIRIISEIKPMWFVFENVEGIQSFEKGLVVKKLETVFSDMGYSTQSRVLTASDFGVPQNRNRFFMVGNRIGIDFVFPNGTDKRISVHQAINDLPVLKNGDVSAELPYKKRRPSDYAKFLRKNSATSKQNFVTHNQPYVIERYRHIRQGKNWRSLPKELMDNYKNIDNCHSGIYKRLDPQKPSVVIANYRKNMLIHPYEDRGLSVREAARIQSFPDAFLFEGSLMHVQQQIGNAVPPLLAKALFEQIIKMTDHATRQ